ncbi:MAG: hypothetical protein GEEBNDBF_02719 [bacterium]|nr:hypothetical protein [bacterium]
MTSHQLGILLDPLDVLMFRDARPFGVAGFARSGLPRPATLLGALRTSLGIQLGVDFEKLGTAMKRGASFGEALTADQPAGAASLADMVVRGPWLARSSAGQVEPLVACPANLRRVESEDGSAKLIRLDPQKDALPGWQPPEPGMLPLYNAEAGQSKRAKGFLTLDGLQAYLAGDTPALEHLVSASDLYGGDRRVGIKIDTDSRTAEDSFLYSADFLALKAGTQEAPRVRFYADLSGPESILELLRADASPLRWGGEGRYAAVTCVEPVVWPQSEPTRESAGRVLLLTTAAPFDQGWKPAGLECQSAAVAGYDAVSGWDLVRSEPRPNRFAAQAGSVLFLKSDYPLPATLVSAEDAQAGWGTFLQGSFSLCLNSDS